MSNLKVTISKDDSVIRGVINGYVVNNGVIYAIVVHGETIKEYPLNELKVSKSNGTYTVI